MAFTIVAHAGQHQQLSCRCELHSKAGQRDASFSSIHETPRRNNNDAQPPAQKCIIANAHNGKSPLAISCDAWLQIIICETSFWMIEREKTNHWSQREIKSESFLTFTPFYGDILPLVIGTIYPLLWNILTPCYWDIFIPCYWDIFTSFYWDIFTPYYWDFLPLLLGHFTIGFIYKIPNMPKMDFLNWLFDW